MDKQYWYVVNIALVSTKLVSYKKTDFYWKVSSNLIFYTRGGQRF